MGRSTKKNNLMSSAPSHAPSSGSDEAEVSREYPAIADARRGFGRWILSTVVGGLGAIKDAIGYVTWKPAGYLLRKTYNGAIWPVNYLDRQWNILKNSRIVKGIGFGLQTERFKLFGAGHAHGGGEEGEAAHH